MKCMQMSVVMIKQWFVTCPDVMKQKTQNTAYTCSDQSGSDEEIPTMSATSAISILWSCDDISPQIVPFTGECRIKIPLPFKDIPFSWLKAFLDDDLINSFTVETNQYANQYLNTVGLSPHSWDRNYKDATKNEMWAYLGISFMIGIDTQPEIISY